MAKRVSATHDVNEVTRAVLTASRVLVAVSARSLGAAADRVTLPQFRMLVVLATHGDSTLVALAGRLAVNPSTAMRMVDRLAAGGLVTRGTNPGNRRELSVGLTGEGREIVDSVTERRRAEIAEIVKRMPHEQREVLVEALSSFADAAGEPPVEGDVDPFRELEFPRVTT